MLALCIYFAPCCQGEQNSTSPQQHANTQLAEPGGQQHPTGKAATTQNGPEWYKSPEWVLIIVGVITAFFIGWQSLETRKAAQATKLAAIATLRPKVKIRGIMIIPGHIVPVAGQDEVQSWQIKIGLANSGGSKADVIASNLTITKTDPFSDGFQISMPSSPPYDDSRDFFGHFSLQPGEHTEKVVTLDLGTTVRLRIHDFIRAGGGGSGREIYWLGFIQYEDDLKISRRTAFAFRYDLGSKSFVRVDNPEWNYED
jgi:hypothetical protein